MAGWYATRLRLQPHRRADLDSDTCERSAHIIAEKPFSPFRRFGSSRSGDGPKRQDFGHPRSRQHWFRRLHGRGSLFGMEVIAWSENLTPERAQAQGARLVFQGRAVPARGHPNYPPGAQSSDARLGRCGRACGHEALGAAREHVAWTDRPGDGAHRGTRSTQKLPAPAIDVFDVEPLPSDHPYRSLENALATPHIGYVSRELFRTFYGDTVRKHRRMAGSAGPRPRNEPAPFEEHTFVRTKTE